MSEISYEIPVGRVVRLWRYPVKSMGPEALKEAEIDWNGVAGDRRWAFVRDNAVQSSFPWLTLRECPNMARYIPTFDDADKPDTSATIVKTPSGDEFDVADPALARVLCRNGARVIRHARGIFDTFPLSLITTQTIARLGDARMRVDKRDGRCVVITIDPETGVRTPSILKAVRTERQGSLGVYGTTTAPGNVVLSDPVVIEH